MSGSLYKATMTEEIALQTFLEKGFRSSIMDVQKLYLSIPNRTKFFVPDKDKAIIQVVNPKRHKSKQSKRFNYRIRLYWHYKYCEDHNGQTFYYTLTYNDAHCPQYMGHNCFDFSDIAWFLNGGFKKQLERKYGTDLKYFVGAELGEGAGSRGMENNPHYHILFFLEPSKKDDAPVYKKISPLEFRHLVRTYWQGFDESVTGYNDYRSARFGIAKEGLNDGLVTSFAACTYCAKYVTKDLAIKQMEEQVIPKIEKSLQWMLDLNDERVKRSFYEDWILPETGFYLDDLSDFWKLDFFRITQNFEDGFWIGQESFVTEFYQIYKNWVYERYVEKVRKEVNDFKNRFSQRVRISNGIGDYALEFITNKMEPTITIPDEGQQFITVAPTLYYYRKLFTDVIKIMESDGTRYVRLLNHDGVNYKVNKLQSQIDKVYNETLSLLQSLTKDVYDNVLASPINKNVRLSFNDLYKTIENDGKQLSEIVSEYAVYKLVYEGRFYKAETDRYGFAVYPDLFNYVEDYRRFITPSYYVSRYDGASCRYMLSGGCQDYLPYSSHTRFFCYMRYFDCFTLFRDYFANQADIEAEETWKQNEKIRKFHKRAELKQFYKQFK